MRSRQHEITLAETATIAGVYETFVRTAGTAREEVVCGNLLQILTAGDDVEDEDIDDCDTQDAGRRRPPRPRRRGLIQP